MQTPDWAREAALRTIQERLPAVAVGIAILIGAAFVLGLMFPRSEPRNPLEDSPSAYTACTWLVRDELPAHRSATFPTYRARARNDARPAGDDITVRAYSGRHRFDSHVDYQPLGSPHDAEPEQATWTCTVTGHGTRWTSAGISINGGQIRGP